MAWVWFAIPFSRECVGWIEELAKNLKDEIKIYDGTFRETLTFTIGSEDAKDFERCNSFKKLDNGHYEIGVHIAEFS